MCIFDKTGRKTTRFCLLKSSSDMKKRVKLSESLPFLSKKSHFLQKNAHHTLVTQWVNAIKEPL